MRETAAPKTPLTPKNIGFLLVFFGLINIKAPFVHKITSKGREPLSTLRKRIYIWQR